MNCKPVMLETALDGDAPYRAFPAFHLIWPDLVLQAIKSISGIRNITASPSSDIIDMDPNSDSHIVINKLKRVYSCFQFDYITSLFPQNSELIVKTLELNAFGNDMKKDKTDSY